MIAQIILTAVKGLGHAGKFLVKLNLDNHPTLSALTHPPYAIAFQVILNFVPIQTLVSKENIA